MVRSSLVAAAGLAMGVSGVHAQPCAPTFSDRFAVADLNGNINTLAAFSDAQGPALYAGGTFTTASGTPMSRVARWRGEGWEPVGAGLNGTVNAMVVFNDGNGPAVYAAGAFSQSGTTAVTRVAKWNGSAWEALGTGLSSTVKALAVFDEDGAGPLPARLFAGGDFTTAGGINASRLARWDGSSWSAVSTGCDGAVETLHVHDNGSGPALYVGGAFTNAGGVTVNRIAKYDGAAFSALGSGTISTVKVLGSHDPDGPGGNPSQLIVGGDFTTIGGISANRIARWTGSQWLDMGAGLNAAPGRVRVHNDGNGEALFVGGAFTTAGGQPAERMAKWDGASWSAVTPTGPSSTVNDFVPFDDGRGSRLFVGGAFTQAGGANAVRIGTWDGTKWAGLDRSVDATVDALGTHGGEVFIAGSFTRADGKIANRIVRFDGENFFPIGSGIPSGTVNAMLSYNDGSGAALYLGGSFTQADGVTVNRIGRWRNGAFSPVMVGTNNGVNGNVNALAVYNDGTGPALYAAGSFSNAGGTSVARIAKWDGAGWVALDSGVNSTVNALAVYSDPTAPSGQSLYAGGSFTTAGGIAVSRLAKWNGTAWSDVGGGVNSTVNELAAYNGELYVGGTFTIAGATSVNRIARWNGTSWLDVASGVNNTVTSMEVHDEDGAGAAAPVLMVGGSFTTAGGNTASRIARWNGTAWTPVGVNAEGTEGTVNTLLSVGSGKAAGLYLGGQFMLADGISSGRIARWGCPQEPCYANCDGSTASPVLNVADFGCFLQRFSAGDPYANCDGSTAAPMLNVADFGCFLQKFSAGCP